MRKLMRSVARHYMEREGIQHINRTPKRGKSFFATHWRQYARGVRR
jgi:hypothetical protein